MVVMIGGDQMYVFDIGYQMNVWVWMYVFVVWYQMIQIMWRKDCHIRLLLDINKRLLDNQ